MKHPSFRFLPVVLLLTACQSSEQPQCPENTFSTWFMSELVLKGDNAVAIEEGAKDGLTKEVFQNAINLALSGKVQALDPIQTAWDPDTIILGVDYLKQKLFGIDTMYMENPNPPYNLVMTVVKDSFQLDQAMSIRPYETWKFDALRISKKVEGYTVVRENVDPVTGEFRGTEPLFLIRNSAAVGSPRKIGTTRYMQQINYAEASGNPFLWNRLNLEISVRERFFGDIVSKALDGTLTAYSDPADSAHLGKEQLKARLQRKDKVFIESPDPPYDLQEITMDVTADKMDIVAIEFLQDIYLDDNGNLSIEVKAYGPATGETDKYGKLSKTQTMFWLKN